MAKSLFSSNWYRVAGLKPRLRSHAHIHRQSFRGDVWYVMQDRQSGRFHRISPAANLIVCLMDGRRNVAEIWALACKREPDDPPTQDETIQLLSQLYGADLLHGDVSPDVIELVDRSTTQQRRQMMSKLRNPLAIRVPLFDPDRFLNVTMPLVRPIFTVWGFLAWLGLLGSALVLATLHYASLANDIVTQAVAAQNLMLLALVYPAVKLLHEMGHGYATKAWGGEVHEFGLMFLIFVPLPYVDASASAAFPEKWRRAIVSGAGIMVELTLAAVAMIVWVNAEAGLVRGLALNLILIGGISTVIFNGNPLLRFDGYYIFQDLIEIPNLLSRANRYFFYVVQRYLFGAHTVESPATHPGERRWLLGYSILAGIYRLGVTLGIAIFVATKFFFVGVAIGIWVLCSSIVFPLAKGLAYILRSRQLNGVRRRAYAVTGAFTAVVLVVLFVLPMPYSTLAQGVVWVAEESLVRSQADGIVVRLEAQPGALVMVGQPIFKLEDSSLDSLASIHRAQAEEFALKLSAARVLDRVQADILEAQVRHIGRRLAVIAQRQRDLVVRSSASGHLLFPQASDVIGRYLKRGDLIGYVVGSEATVLRVVVPQSRIDLVRSRTIAIEARFAEDLGRIRRAKILRETPAARVTVPSAALTTEGGGDVILDPKDPQKLKALQGLFVLDLQLNGGEPAYLVGGRVYVRFDHGAEPLIFRAAREFRQVFLSTFGV